MRKCVFAVAVVLGMAASGVHAADGAAATDSVTVQSPISFAEDAVIARSVKNECELGEKLSSFIKQYGEEKGVTVSLVPHAEATAPGRVLVVEITDSLAEGNAFTGHHTYTTVKGKLYQDGQQVGNFLGRRNSMGGAFGGFKGNCSVLGRTVEALGEDIADWLTHPDKDGMLGDLD
ncbi:hypothetical protein [Frateuria defendens]|uniref:hypothetical protein n=1 Tax=Frateuria defendens TaxID=2219559 RepID=UPI00066FFB44|nr:hypothetical protein [Frateuria defendens]